MCLSCLDIIQILFNKKKTITSQARIIHEMTKQSMQYMYNVADV